MDADITGGNSQTGADSSNSNQTNLNTQSTVNISNSASTTNSGFFTVNTGNNQVTQNTTVGPVSSGAVDVDLGVVTTQNAAAQLPGQPVGQSVTVSQENSQTGAGSSNSTTITTHTASSVSQVNSSQVTNAFAAAVNTGGNKVSGNTVVGAVHSGDVRISVHFATVQNSTPTPSTPVVTPTPVVDVPGTPDVPVVLFGKGAGDDQSFPITLASVTVPVSGGKGAGYFPSGTPGLGGEIFLAVGLALLVAFAGPIRRFFAR